MYIVEILFTLPTFLFPNTRTVSVCVECMWCDHFLSVDNFASASMGFYAIDQIIAGFDARKFLAQAF